MGGWGSFLQASGCSFRSFIALGHLAEQQAWVRLEVGTPRGWRCSAAAPWVQSSSGSETASMLARHTSGSSTMYFEKHQNLEVLKIVSPSSPEVAVRIAQALMLAHVISDTNPRCKLLNHPVCGG